MYIYLKVVFRSSTNNKAKLISVMVSPLNQPFRNNFYLCAIFLISEIKYTALLFENICKTCSLFHSSNRCDALWVNVWLNNILWPFTLQEYYITSLISLRTTNTFIIHMLLASGLHVDRRPVPEASAVFVFIPVQDESILTFASGVRF